MRILYLSHSSRISGAEISLLTHLDHLAGHGVEAWVACPPGELDQAVRQRGLPRVTVPDFEVSFSRDPRRLAAVAALLPVRAAQWAAAIRGAAPDLVHANSVRAGLLAGLGRPLHGRPVITHVRDVLPVNALSGLIQASVRATSTRIIANSRFTARRFAPAAPGGLSVIHNAADLRAFDPARETGAGLRAEFDLKHTYPLLAVVGQITPWKGQLEAIRALAQIRHHQPNAHLLIVGENRFDYGTARYDNAAYAAELRATVAMLGLNDAVTFTGFRRDIPAVMAAADLVLMPSWEEPFGRTVVEALAMGTPVVATETGGPAEIIEAGITGALVPARDPAALAAAVLELGQTPERLRQMSRAARRQVLARFTPERMAAETVAVYRQLRVPAAARPIRSTTSEARS